MWECRPPLGRLLMETSMRAAEVLTPEEIAVLARWLEDPELPEPPFLVEPWCTVDDPARWLGLIRAELAAGPEHFYSRVRSRLRAGWPRRTAGCGSSGRRTSSSSPRATRAGAERDQPRPRTRGSTARRDRGRPDGSTGGEPPPGSERNRRCDKLSRWRAGCSARDGPIPRAPADLGRNRPRLSLRLGAEAARGRCSRGEMSAPALWERGQGEAPRPQSGERQRVAASPSLPAGQMDDLSLAATEYNEWDGGVAAPRPRHRKE